MTDNPSVLVIDDEPGLREMLALELSLEGFAVEAVDSGAAAVEAVRRRRFDVAITDLKMPAVVGRGRVRAAAARAGRAGPREQRARRAASSRAGVRFEIDLPRAGADRQSATPRPG